MSRCRAGDPVLDDTQTTDQPLPGPFAGLTMNCRPAISWTSSASTPEGGCVRMLILPVRSPVPAREDGKLTTSRNSPPLVNATLDRPGGLLLHLDAEFSTLEDLIAATFTGRNLRVAARQKAEAIHHIATAGGAITARTARRNNSMANRTAFCSRGQTLPSQKSFALTSEFRVAVDSGN